MRSKKPTPEHVDDFDYTLCTILLTHGWSDFSDNRQLAAAVKGTRIKGIPTTFRGMMAHPFLIAFEKENHRHNDTGLIKANWRKIDWKSIDPDLIDDMMLIFDTLVNPDGSHKKFKSNMNFRGDQCKNLKDHLMTRMLSISFSASWHIKNSTCGNGYQYRKYVEYLWVSTHYGIYAE